MYVKFSVDSTGHGYRIENPYNGKYTVLWTDWVVHKTAHFSGSRTATLGGTPKSCYELISSCNSGYTYELYLS